MSDGHRALDHGDRRAADAHRLDVLGRADDLSVGEARPLEPEALLGLEHRVGNDAIVPEATDETS